MTQREHWTIRICPKCREQAQADEEGCCVHCGEWLGGEGTGDEDRTLTVLVRVAS